MLRLSCWLLIFAGLAWSQFTELATSDDAQHLYFTSQLRLSPVTAAARPEYRIYHLGPKGLELFAERGALTSENPGGFSGGSSDGVAAPQVSSDGLLVGYTARNVCPNGSPCTPVQAEGLLGGTDTADLGPGYLQMSRSGRYVVLTQHLFASGLPPSDVSHLIDRQTHHREQIPTPPGDSGMVASNGAVLVRQSASSWFNALGIWNAGQFTVVPLNGVVRPLALSNDSGTLAFTRLNSSGRTQTVSLVSRHLSTGQETTLYASDAPGRLPNFLGISNDGRLVLYNVWDGAASGVAYIANTATGTSTALVLGSGEVATAGTLAGSGRAAYLATSKGRIVRIWLTGGEPVTTETVVPETPYVTPRFNLAPGSLVKLEGVLPDSIEELRGHILLDGVAIPVLKVGTSDIRAQVPWEQKIGTGSLNLTVPGGSPFQQSDLVFIPPFAPDIERATPEDHTLLGLKLIKGDFSGLVTTAPGPGEIVHAYFTGLGPVNGHVPTGEPTPADTIYPVTGHLTCQFLPQQGPMETLFAGLAPGMIGIYQVSFRLPPDAGQAPINGLKCDFQGESGSGGFVIFGPPQP